jgi:hypothetical protein
MPGNHGFWFNDDQDAAPRRPQTAEQNPEYPIHGLAAVGEDVFA